MGLTISYDIRLAARKAVPAFLAAARAEARKRRWTIPRKQPGHSSLELVPHKQCESVRLDFSRSLRCEEFVKTSSAPLKTHVQVVEFLRAMTPYAKSLRVEDECEYWETADKKLLKKHRDDFGRAMGTKASKASDKPITFTFGAVVVRSK